MKDTEISYMVYDSSQNRIQNILQALSLVEIHYEPSRNIDDEPQGAVIHRSAIRGKDRDKLISILLTLIIDDHGTEIHGDSV